MKKLLFVFMTMMILLLVACGSDELQEFVDAFNENAKTYDVPELIPEEFGDIEDEEGMTWQQLYESRNYTIDARYKDGKNLFGFHLAIDNNQPYEKLEGVAYHTGITISEALNLNIDKYVKEFETALTTTSHTYTDGDYRIEFFYPGSSSMTSVGMIINFDKK